MNLKLIQLHSANDKLNSTSLPNNFIKSTLLFLKSNYQSD